MRLTSRILEEIMGGLAVRGERSGQEVGVRSDCLRFRASVFGKIV